MEEETELGGDAALDGRHAEDGLSEVIVDQLEGRGGCDDDEEESGEDRGLESCGDHCMIETRK